MPINEERQIINEQKDREDISNAMIILNDEEQSTSDIMITLN